MRDFIFELGEYKHILNKQTVKTLKGQYLAGDKKGAINGLTSSIKKLVPMEGAHRNAKIYQNIYKQDYCTQRDVCLSVIYKMKKEANNEQK